MSKIIKGKKDKEVKFVFADDAEIKLEKDPLGQPVIHIPNYPPAKIVGNARYLGGTYICDHKFVDDVEIIEDVQNVPLDIKDKKYKYDKKTKQFTPMEVTG